jgi:4-amino-4-deoxy-L-arabinose transferase-like glycosyltransferase
MRIALSGEPGERSVTQFGKLSPWIWCFIWLVLVTGGLLLRPLLPIDETRYVSVAWEMWLNGNYLVPHLNDAAYSHKPPLLFWLINGGWAVFGINDWTPRLIAPLFGLGSLFLTSHLAKRFWPASQTYLLAPLLLLGCFYWGLYTTLTMFDLMIAFWALTGIHGLIDAWQGRALRGWTLFGIAIGLGILSKGPVILLFLIPAALLAPYWAVGGPKLRLGFWYLGSALGVILGAAIALGWALPAGMAGGEEYRNAIFWGQSAGRLVSSFAHQQPIWWYLAILPGLLLPWIVWPSLLQAVWRSARGALRTTGANGGPPDAGLRLAAVWSLVALVLLSVISGKRPHYLLPVFPAIAIAGAALAARLNEGDLIGRRLDMAPAAAIAGLLGLVVLAAPQIGAGLGLDALTDTVPVLWALPLLAAAALLMIVPPAAAHARILAIGGLSAILLVSLQGIAQPRLDQAYDLAPLAKRLSEAQSRGYTIANYGKYHGQFNFLGRLTKPLVETGDGEIMQFLKDNPNAKIVSYHDRIKKGPAPDYVQIFRNRLIAVWDGRAVLIDPDVAKRNSPPNTNLPK